MDWKGRDGKERKGFCKGGEKRNKLFEKTTAFPCVYFLDGIPFDEKQKEKKHSKKKKKKRKRKTRKTNCKEKKLYIMMIVFKKINKTPRSRQTLKKNNSQDRQVHTPHHFPSPSKNK